MLKLCFPVGGAQEEREISALLSRDPGLDLQRSRHLRSVIIRRGPVRFEADVLTQQRPEPRREAWRRIWGNGHTTTGKNSRSLRFKKKKSALVDGRSDKS